MKLTKTVFLQYLKLDTVTIVWLLHSYETNPQPTIFCSATSGTTASTNGYI